MFPEIVTTCAQQLPERSLVDGELVIWHDEKLAFGELLRRLSSGVRRAPRLSREVCASLVLFDVLALDATDARRLSYDDRRERLEATLQDASPPILLSPMTMEREVAKSWSEDMAIAGIEGIVVKGAAQAYKPGKRQWVKVKRRFAIAATLPGMAMIPFASVLAWGVGSTVGVGTRTPTWLMNWSVRGAGRHSAFRSGQKSVARSEARLRDLDELAQPSATPGERIRMMLRRTVAEEL